MSFVDTLAYRVQEPSHHPDPDYDDDSLERICLEMAAKEQNEDSLDKLLEKCEDDEDDYDV